MTPSETSHLRAIAERKRRASQWTLYSNSLLLVLKVLVGAITGSVAVLAEVVNSAADLVGSVIVYLSVRYSDEPPDDTHAYGHGKVENLSGIITATLILTGGCITIFQAVARLFHPVRLTMLPWAAAAMVFSALLNAFVSSQLLRVSRDTESPALAADGEHLKTDMLTSIGVLFGLVLISVTGAHCWDSVAALGVSLLILRVGFTVARDALDMLVDRALPEHERRLLEEVLWTHPSVRAFHRLRTRRAGSQRHADVHVLLDDDFTLVEAHRIAEDVEDKMREALPNLDAMVHPEPYAEEIRHQQEIHGHVNENVTH